MKSVDAISKQITKNGFAIIDNVFTSEEIDAMLLIISTANPTKSTFRRTNDLFAIRQFFKELPHIRELVFTKKLNSLIVDLFGTDYSIVNHFILTNRQNRIVCRMAPEPDHLS